MTYTGETPAPSYEAYCSLCNQICLYVITRSGTRNTKADILERYPSPGGRWVRRSDGVFHRLDSSDGGRKPHRCWRNLPSRTTLQEVAEWHTSTLRRLDHVRNKWCVDASSWAVKQTQCLFGADDNTRGFTGAQGIETQLGKKMGVRNRHYSWAASTHRIGDVWNQDLADGTIPMISLGGQGYTRDLVREIVAGTHDMYWNQLLEAIGEGRGLIRPWMEMNGAHNAYSGDPGLFVQMWRRIHTLATQQHSTLTWIFCPQQYDPHSLWPAYYPGDSYCDWIGLDLYRATFNAADPWRTSANLHKKPFCICESGFEQGKVVSDPTTGLTFDKDGSLTTRSLIERTRADVHKHPNTVMYLVWNNIGPIGNDFIDTSEKSLEQYREFASDRYYKFSV